MSSSNEIKEEVGDILLDISEDRVENNEKLDEVSPIFPQNASEIVTVHQQPVSQSLVDFKIDEGKYLELYDNQKNLENNPQIHSIVLLPRLDELGSTRSDLQTDAQIHANELLPELDELEGNNLEGDMQFQPIPEFADLENNNLESNAQIQSSNILLPELDELESSNMEGNAQIPSNMLLLELNELKSSNLESNVQIPSNILLPELDEWENRVEDVVGVVQLVGGDMTTSDMDSTANLDSVSPEIETANCEFDVVDQLADVPSTDTLPILMNEPVSMSIDHSSTTEKDTQIRLLRDILMSVSDLLADKTQAPIMSLPEVLDDLSTSAVVATFANMIAHLVEHKQAPTPPLPLPQSCPEEKVTTAPAKEPELCLPDEEESGWEEVNDWQPTPDYGLESPVISHLLANWTTDTSKIDFLRSWVRSLYMPSYEGRNYPPGLQITNLSEVLRDGFMVLLVPLIRSLSKPALTVHVKRHLMTTAQLANQATSNASTPTNNTYNTNTNNAMPARSFSRDSADSSLHVHAPTDPFAREVLFDIRIKRMDVTLPVNKERDAEYMSDVVAVRQFGAHGQGSRYRGDSDYYSPLSEINSALTAIEAKTKRRVLDHNPGGGHAIVSPFLSPNHSPHGPKRKGFEEDYTGVRGAVSEDTDPAAPSFSSGPAAAGPLASATAGLISEAAAPASATILQSLYSWWGAPATVVEPVVEPVVSPPLAQLASLAPAEATPSVKQEAASHKPETSPVPVSSTAAGQETERNAKGSDDVNGVITNTTNKIITTTTTTTVNPDTLTSSSEASAPLQDANANVVSAPVTHAPVNKIASRLQQMRDQKYTL